MAKAIKHNDRFKYEITLRETQSRGKVADSAYSNSLTEARKIIRQRALNTNWTMKITEGPSGFVYECGMVNGYWHIKKQLAYIHYDKSEGIVWYKAGNNEYRMIKADGSLGITKSAYWKQLNKLRGL